MIEAYVYGQELRIYTPIIVSDTIDYITAQVSFSEEWNAYALKYMQLKNRGEDPTTYVIPIDEQGRIGKEQHLNLSAGLWDLSVFAGTGAGRVTSNRATINVEWSGLRDAPMGELPISTAEMLDVKATRAAEYAQSVVDRANRGEFNGRDGTGFVLKGYFETEAELPEEGETGDMYGVGTEEPYDIYAWDSINERWVNNGTIQGPPGQTGANGKYAVPSVDEGYLSWQWDDGSTTGLPGRKYIQGEQGPQGQTGPEGKSAYQAAMEAGYTGSEQSFNQHLAYIDSHAATHKPDGSDPITGLDKRSMSSSIFTAYLNASVSTSWTQNSSGYYYQNITVTGLADGDRPNVHFKPPESFSDLADAQEAFNLLFDAEVTAANTLKLYAREQPETAFTVTLEVPRI